MIFVAFEASRSIPAQWHNYRKYCDVTDISLEACSWTAFVLAFSTLFFAGCEIYGAFFIVAVYQASKQHLEKPMK